MKWNDIKKHIAKIDSTIDAGSEKITTSTDVTNNPNQTTNKIVRFIFLFVVLVIIILGIIIIIQLFKKNENKPVLPTEQLQEVATFLDENPPVPLSNDQAQVINDVLNKPVSLTDDDLQSINNFLNQ